MVPGLLQPQTGSFIGRCRIALSAKGAPISMAGLGLAAGLTSSARATRGASSMAAAARVSNIDERDSG